MRHVVYENVKPFDFKGLQIRELTPDGLATASIAEIEIAPGTRHETARSTKSDKIYIGIEGDISFQVENRDVKLKPGEILLIQSGEWFNYHNASGEIAKVFLMHIPPFELESEQFHSQ